jgi:F-type H+-transporting ATPase subunit b
MLIDWFTVIAQVINFLILVWLLKRFLYRPILNAIDAREKRIAAEISDADEKKAQALKERDEFQYKNVEFDKQRSNRIHQLEEEAEIKRAQLLDDARKESLKSCVINY